MHFDFVTEYIPGSQLGTADVLSRFPLTNQPQLIDTSDIIEGYVSTIITSLPLTDVMINKLILATAADTTLQHAITYCTTSWPDVNDLTLDLKSYWHSRDLLTIQDNLILYNSRIVVPSSLRQETLTALHAGHLSIEKCRAKARQSGGQRLALISSTSSQPARHADIGRETKPNLSSQHLCPSFLGKKWERIYSK